MNVLSILGGIVSTPLAALIVARLWHYVQQALAWEQGLGTDLQALIATTFAALVPIINAKWGLNIPTDFAGAFSQPALQSLVAVVLTLLFKGHLQAQTATASGGK